MTVNTGTAVPIAPGGTLTIGPGETVTIGPGGSQGPTGLVGHVSVAPTVAPVARPDRPELLPPGQMPKRGKGGSDRGRIAMLHALAHIEDLYDKYLRADIHPRW